MTLVAKLRARRVQPLISAAEAAYAGDASHSDRQTQMLDRLNRVWSIATTNVPRYRDLLAGGSVPKQFDSLEQFTQTVPPLTKSVIRDGIEPLGDQRRPADKAYTTGGSTGQPTSIPGWHSELPIDMANRWLGRSFYGIRPSDRLFLIWGHHHLLGTGWKAKLKGRVRAAKDGLVGCSRFSSYDLSAARCDEAARLILRHRPDYIVGYSSTLDLLARTATDRASQFKALGMKAAIACAEVYPATDSPDRISETLGCPAAMEYGAVETGVTAYTTPEGGYKVFWLDHLFELGEPGPGGGRVLRVTSLYERKTPLIRYEIGDEIMPIEGEPLIGPARIQSVLGRVNSIITLPDGKAVHTAAVSRAISDRRDVSQFQIVDRPGGMGLRIVAASESAKDQILTHVRGNLIRLSPSLKDAPIDFVDRIEQTRAGKTPLVVREDSPAQE